MVGLMMWGKVTRAFIRDILIPKGWTKDNSRNYATTVSPNGQYAIVVVPGDVFTSRKDGNPTTRNERGPATIDAIISNQLQLSDISNEFPSLGVRQTWFLLHYEEIDKETGEINDIRLELSLPVGDTDGVVDEWVERIILQPVTNDLPPANEDNDEGEDFGFAIGKK